MSEQRKHEFVVVSTPGQQTRSDPHWPFSVYRKIGLPGYSSFLFGSGLYQKLLLHDVLFVQMASKIAGQVGDRRRVRNRVKVL